MAAQLPPTDRQTTTQLFRRIVNGLNGLVDRHVQLIKQELKEELFTAIGAGKWLGIGVGVAIVRQLTSDAPFSEVTSAPLSGVADEPEGWRSVVGSVAT